MSELPILHLQEYIPTFHNDDITAEVERCHETLSANTDYLILATEDILLFRDYVVGKVGAEVEFYHQVSSRASLVLREGEIHFMRGGSATPLWAASPKVRIDMWRCLPEFLHELTLYLQKAV